MKKKDNKLSLAAALILHLAMCLRKMHSFIHKLQATFSSQNKKYRNLFIHCPNLIYHYAVIIRGA